MNSSFTKIFFPLLVLCYCYNAANGTASFDAEAVDLSGIKLLGDAHVLNGSFRLSRDTLTPDSGAGRVLYRYPIYFQQSLSAFQLSFSTNFTLLITNSNKDRTGGGAAFVISPDDNTIGGSGGNLGVPRGSISIEFDTKRDVEFEDISGNHLGVNLGSMVSSKVVDLDLFHIDLRSGRPVNAWVDYSGLTCHLNIYVSYRNTKPVSPVLSLYVDLSLYANGSMYVGFTASTEESTETHSVRRWSFLSSYVGPGSEADPNSPPPLQSPKSDSNIQTLLAKIFPWGMVVMAVAAAGGTWYCIRYFHCNHECNNTSFNCCS